METFSALLAICAGNSPVAGELPAQRPVTRSFDVFFDLRLNKRLSIQSWDWWFETLSRPLWRHCNSFPYYWPFVRGNDRWPVIWDTMTLIWHSDSSESPWYPLLPLISVLSRKRYVAIKFNVAHVNTSVLLSIMRFKICINAPHTRLFRQHYIDCTKAVLYIIRHIMALFAMISINTDTPSNVHKMCAFLLFLCDQLQTDFTHGLQDYFTDTRQSYALLWRHNGRGSVSNHQPHGCLLNRLFRRRSKKISKLCVTGLCAGNSPGTGEFPALMARECRKYFHLMTSSCDCPSASEATMKYMYMGKYNVMNPPSPDSNVKN